MVNTRTGSVPRTALNYVGKQTLVLMVFGTMWIVPLRLTAWYVKYHKVRANWFSFESCFFCLLSANLRWQGVSTLICRLPKWQAWHDGQWLVDGSIDWLIYWFIDRSFDQLFNWLVWLIDWWITCFLSDNKVIQLLRDEPTIEITKVLLELGPNVTEAIIHSFLNATRLKVSEKVKVKRINRKIHQTQLTNKFNPKY